jgi:hypothetical protein
MIVVNFSHPLTNEQCAQIEHEAGQPVERVISVPAQFDENLSFLEQVRALIEGAGLTAEEWQTLPLVIVPPSYAPIVALLLASLHGLAGHFPTVVRLRPRADSPVPAYDVAELLSLENVCGAARRERWTK